MKSLRVLMCSALAVGLAAPVAAHAQLIEESALTVLNLTDTASVAYTGKWHQTEGLFNWSGGTSAITNFGPGAKATLTFNGTGVTWISALNPDGGQARVWLDGVLRGTVDTRSPNVEKQAPVFTLSGLAPGAHTLMIEATWTRSDGAPCDTNTKPCFIIVDAFDIEGPQSGRLQEAGPAAVTYFGAWTQGDTSTNWSGGTAAFSDGDVVIGTVPADPACAPNPCQGGVTNQAVLLFKGTQVAWLGAKGQRGGQANVYIDGKKVASVVDTYDATDQKATIFTSAVLPRGIHTLAIEVTRTKNPSSSDFIVFVDAFNVTP